MVLWQFWAKLNKTNQNIHILKYLKTQFIISPYLHLSTTNTGSAPILNSSLVVLLRSC